MELWHPSFSAVGNNCDHDQSHQNLSCLCHHPKRLQTGKSVKFHWDPHSTIYIHFKASVRVSSQLAELWSQKLSLKSAPTADLCFPFYFYRNPLMKCPIACTVQQITLLARLSRWFNRPSTTETCWNTLRGLAFLSCSRRLGFPWRKEGTDQDDLRVPRSSMQEEAAGECASSGGECLLQVSSTDDSFSLSSQRFPLIHRCNFFSLGGEWSLGGVECVMNIWTIFHEELLLKLPY